MYGQMGLRLRISFQQNVVDTKIQKILQSLLFTVNYETLLRLLVPK
jgi:hypothetical protein